MKLENLENLRQFASALGITLLLGACAGQSNIPATAEEAVAALEADIVASNDTLVAEDGSEEELVCRSEIRTGTNFRRRTCKTAEEWAAQSRFQRSAVEERAANERVQAGVEQAAGLRP